MSRRGLLALAVALLLLHFALRLHNLLALPLFVDETWLATRAESAAQGHVLWFGRESKLLGLWWTALFAPLHPWPLRVATLLFALPGVAGLLALARRLFGARAILPTGLLLALTPMSFFLERMALPDAQLVAPLALLLLGLERTLRRPQRNAALLAGAALAAAIMTKATALALLPLPLLAVGLLPRTQSWRERLRTLARVYGTALALWLPLLALLRLRNVDYLGAAWRIGGAAVETDSMLQRLPVNASFLLQGLIVYHGALPLLLAALLMLLALLKRPRRSALPALASLLAFLAVSLSGSGQLSMRYWLIALPPALLLCAGGLTLLRDRLRAASLAPLPWLALALWLATVALPFIRTAWDAPADLTLPRKDWYEYVMADSAGTMIPELAELLAQEARQVEGTLVVTGAIAQCDTLGLYLRTLPEVARIVLDCPRIMTPAGSGAGLDAHVTSMAQEQANYLVVFEERGLVSVTDIRSPGLETLAELPRPGDLVTISVYRPLLP